MVNSTFFEELSSQETIPDFFVYINDAMYQVPALVALLVIFSVIAISLIKSGESKVDAITAGMFVITVIGFFFRVMGLIGDKIIIGIFILLAILMYFQIAGKSDYE